MSFFFLFVIACALNDAFQFQHRPSPVFGEQEGHVEVLVEQEDEEEEEEEERAEEEEEEAAVAMCNGDGFLDTPLKWLEGASLCKGICDNITALPTAKRIAVLFRGEVFRCGQWVGIEKDMSCSCSPHTQLAAVDEYMRMITAFEERGFGVDVFYAGYGCPNGRP